MELGFVSLNTPRDLGPAALGRELEARGFESLWIGEHAHLPATGRVRYPAGDGSIPEPYKHMADMFVSLAMAASATKTLKITPFCAEEAYMGFCTCTCKGGYVLGQTCDGGAGGGAGTGGSHP